MNKHSNELINRRKAGRTERSSHAEELARKGISDNHPFSVEYALGLFFVLLLGFFGSQKLIHTISNPNSSINIYAFNEAVCDNGFRLPFLSCEQQNSSTELVTSVTPDQKVLQGKTTDLVTGMNKGPNALSLRKQFSYSPDLKSALKKLKWNDGDEQDAMRFLSIIKSLNASRYSESYFVSSIMSGLIDPVMQKFPDIVAASYCLYCGQFFNDTLKPYFEEGTLNNEVINQLASGHPRFLQALYHSGNIKLDNMGEIARLQAEILSSGDSEAAKLIGSILLKENNLELLHHWVSKGWNGGYAITEYSTLLKLPRQITIDAWQRAITRGVDNAVLTRYLVSTGYRPALRWLIWYHGSNLSYFQGHQHKMERDRYNDFLVERYLDFPKQSHNDLAGFYSKNWKNITWDASKQQWVVAKRQRITTK